MLNMSARLYLRLKEELPSAEFVSAADILWQCRLTKSTEELEFVRKAGECGDEAVKAIINSAHVGVNEYMLPLNVKELS